MTIASRRAAIVALVGALLWISAASGEDAKSPRSPAFEVDIERGLHERLVAVRRRPGATLAPFETDGCSGGLSAGWSALASAFPAFAKRGGERPPWEGCCVAHDRRYHAGGPGDGDAASGIEARRAVDEELRQCVLAYGADRRAALAADLGLPEEDVVRLYEAIADAMYLAVRLGGAPCTGTSWRWGYGWPPC